MLTFATTQKVYVLIHSNPQMSVLSVPFAKRDRGDL